MNKATNGFSHRLASSLPSLQDIDRNIYRVVTFSFPLLTLVIITGAVWAQYVWQRWWNWDPKETASLITWLIYAAYLHGRRQRNWGGHASAAFGIIGFVAVLFTYAGVNLLESIHAYGIPTEGRSLGGFSGVGRWEAALTSGFLLAYVLGFVAALAGVVWKAPGMTRLSLWLVVAAVAGTTGVLALRMVEAGRFTFTSGYDFSLWFAWAAALCALVVSIGKQRNVLLAVLPLVLLVAMYGYLWFPEKGHAPLPPALRNTFWLHVHVSVAIPAYGALALAAGWGILYWLKSAVAKNLRRAG